MQSRRGSIRIIYVLSVYVALQLIWWGYHIIQLSQQLGPSDSVTRRVWMIVGEGSVFLLILGFGLFKIRQMQKRELLSQEKEKNFMLAVTHELKTPIASNRLALETIKNRELQPELQEQLLATAIASNVRLEELVNKILISTELASSEGMNNSASMNLNAALKRVIGEHAESLEPLVGIEVVYGPECQIKMGSLEFDTVINNLIQNAIKYHNGGEKIAIRTKIEEGYVDLHIEDTGPGIPDDEKKKVFDKFYRMGDEMTRSTKGTGLGLFLVKEIVSRNNGKISILDNAPSGCIFKLSFPIYTP